MAWAKAILTSYTARWTWMPVTPLPIVGWLDILPSFARDACDTSTGISLIRNWELVLQNRRHVSRAFCMDCQSDQLSTTKD